MLKDYRWLYTYFDTTVVKEREAALETFTSMSQQQFSAQIPYFKSHNTKIRGRMQEKNVRAICNNIFSVMYTGNNVDDKKTVMAATKRRVIYVTCRAFCRGFVALSDVMRQRDTHKSRDVWRASVYWATWPSALMLDDVVRMWSEKSINCSLVLTVFHLTVGFYGL